MIPAIFSTALPTACRQALLVAAPDEKSISAELHRLERDAASLWQQVGKIFPVSLGRNGLAWGLGEHTTSPPEGFRLTCENARQIIPLKPACAASRDFFEFKIATIRRSRHFPCMNIEDLKDRTKRAVQLPFLIRLSDGQVLAVKHPEFMAFPRDGGSFVFMPETGGIQIVSLNQVVTLDVVTQPAAP